MTTFRRYGIYMVPHGELFDTGSSWLGWDSAAGQRVLQPDLAGLPLPAEDLTATPRKYGIHGTIKPPFRLAEGMDAAGLGAALKSFCAARGPVTIPDPSLRRIGRFLALVPGAPLPELSRLAAAAVDAVEPFRAPLNAGELAKRRRTKLTDRQEALLLRWGYPYVMEEFRFHITLSRSLEPNIIDAVEDALSAHFAPFIGKPLAIADLALMGEDEDGMFHLLHRYALTG